MSARKASGSSQTQQAAEQSNAKNPACDACREKKVRRRVYPVPELASRLSWSDAHGPGLLQVRCGREKPECENCKLWKTPCTYSERLKRENDQSRL